LEGDKIEREKQVNQLILDKEELFLTKYDLERKLADISSSLK
jgi:predicted RNase H-like nuclease (RuvC/YqgF family)